MSSPKPPRKPPLHLTIQRELGAGRKVYARHYVAGARDGLTRNWWLHATKGWRTEASR